MKLLYIMTVITGKGGVQRVIFDKINYLADKYSIDVIHFEEASATPDFPVNPIVRFHSIAVPATSHSVLAKGYSVIQIFQRYRKIVNEIQPDIIINANAMIISWILPFMNRQIPKIVELHQSYDGVLLFNRDAYGANSFRSKLLMYLRNKVYPRYDKVVVLTQTDKNKWNYKNCIVLPNFTNLVPSIHNQEKQDFHFIWVGRMCHQKGIDILLNVWTEYCKLHAHGKLTIVGGGEGMHRNQLEDYLKASPYAKRITYIPKTDDMVSLYQKASVFISTSRFEGLPLVLIEAATMGLPIIGFNITGNDEVVVNGKNGLLVQPDNIAAFIESMQRIKADTSLYELMGKASTQIAQHFSKKEIMNQWEGVFRELGRRHILLTSIKGGVKLLKML